MAISSKKAVTAFVMMNVEGGEAFNVVKYLKKWAKKGAGPQTGAYIKGAWVVSGRNDVMAMAEADTNHELLELVTALVQGSHHSPNTITSTTTMIAEDSLW